MRGHPLQRSQCEPLQHKVYAQPDVAERVRIFGIGDRRDLNGRYGMAGPVQPPSRPLPDQRCGTEPVPAQPNADAGAGRASGPCIRAPAPPAASTQMPKALA